MRSSSSIQTSLWSKLREGISLFRMHLESGGYNYADLDRMVVEYSDLLRLHKKELNTCRVLEIGFGARPFRLFWLLNHDIDVYGVDLDHPLLSPTPAQIRAIWRRNGLERALKSTIRHFLSDQKEYGRMKKALVERRGALKHAFLPRNRVMVANAATKEFWDAAGTFDFIYSEDVFEHIPPKELEALVGYMANALSPNGIALIRPNIFTGIIGGHYLEWYPHTFEKDMHRRTEPWEHLRKQREQANTYLNRLPRRSYVEIFEKHFQILENIAMNPDLGRQFYTEDVRRDLPDLDESELFSNTVRFVLKPL